MDSPCDGDICVTLNGRKILGRRYSNGKKAKFRGLAGIAKAIWVLRSQKVGPLRTHLSSYWFKDMIGTLKLAKNRVGRYSNVPKAKVGNPADYKSPILTLF